MVIYYEYELIFKKCYKAVSQLEPHQHKSGGEEAERRRQKGEPRRTGSEGRTGFLMDAFYFQASPHAVYLPVECPLIFC